MNRAKFEEIKAKVNNIISERDKKLAELQDTIADCYKKISVNSALMDEAETKGDPEAYQREFTLVNMYRDKLRKTENEQRQIAGNPVIGGADYDEVKAFIEAESGIMVNEEVAQIWEHLKAIEEICKRFNDEELELQVLAHTCQNVNQASIMGTFREMTISSLPRHWLSGINESMHFFRPKG